MSTIRILFSVLSIFLVTHISAQNFLPRIVNYSPKDYGELLTPENWSVTQDDQGLMYFGNGNNVLLYDGVRWDTIEIKNFSSVTSLLSYDNRIYCGGAGQFGYLSPNEQGRLRYTSLSDTLTTPFSNVWRIHQVDGNIYFQAYEGVFELSKSGIRTILPKTSFHLSFSIDNKLFVRQRGTGVLQLVGAEFKSVIETDELYGIFDILPYKEKESEYVLVTQEFGLWVYNEEATGKKIRPLNADTCSDIRYKGIIGGVSVGEGTYVLYSVTDGLLVVDDKGNLQDNITRESGLNSDEVKNAYVDQHGNLWLATGAGISQLNDNSPISYYQTANGVIGNVQSVVEFDNTILVGTSLGLFKESLDKPFHFNKTQIQTQTWDFEVIDTNLLFIATSNGLFSTSDMEEYTQIFPHNCNSIYMDRENQLLLAAGQQGVFVVDPFSNWSIIQYYASTPGLVTDIVKHPKTGEYWIGTQNVGAIRGVFDGFEFAFDEFKEADGIERGVIVTPFVSGDEVYFGTPYELLEFVHEDEIKKQLTEEEKRDPLNYRGYYSESKIFGLEPGHNYQQMLFAGGLTFGCIDNNIVLFAEGETYSKDFKSVDIGRINKFTLIEDKLFIGAAEGLLVVDVPKLLWRIDHPQPNQYDAVIRSVGYKDSLMYFGFGKLDGVPELPYYKNKMIFKYSGSFYEGTHQPLYSWRLLGESDIWTEWSVTPTAEFSNLHEGEYEFQIKSINIFGEESSVDTFKFVILTPWYRTLWAYLGYVVLFFCVVYLAIVLGRKRLKAKNIWLEGVVEERTAEIKEKNVELEHSYIEIAEQKQEITDSINYAKRIQEAILPLDEEIVKHVSEYFVLFMPKDIVSGDFYWFHNVGKESIFVCADCTGHGVPGAFMSMIGSDKLNRVVIEERKSNPAEILSHLNKGIKMALKQNELDENATRDGMDAAIVSIDMSNMKLRYAGAHRSLMMIRNQELTETKATKVAVGGFTPEEQEFQVHDISLVSGDCFYMTSDGYADQFGGEKGKKFKMKQFKDLLMDIHQKPMNEQHDILKNTIQDWMRDEYEQIDDICVVGIRIS